MKVFHVVRIDDALVGIGIGEGASTSGRPDETVSSRVHRG
jgi:hypothetical protein